MTKISIALCTYNGEAFLREQLKSISDQTLLPDEIIVCDDNSSDRTCEIVKDFAASAPFKISLFQNPANLGSTKNFEKAILFCSGDIIFLSDQDDEWLPHKIERTMREFQVDNAVGLVFSDAFLVDDALRPLGVNLWDIVFPRQARTKFQTGDPFNLLLRQNVVTGATTAFRASFRENFVPIPDDIPVMIHDAWIALVIANQSTLGLIDEPLIHYRQHSAQQLGAGTNIGRSKLDSDDWRTPFQRAMEYSANEIERLKQLRSLINDVPIFSARRADAVIDGYIADRHEEIKHYRTRTTFSRSRLKRLGPVSREYLTGRYGLYSKGILSAAKDLLYK